MTSPADGPTAPGERSIRIGTNTGIANTGDYPRFMHLDVGTLKSPEQVPVPAGLWNVPRRPSRVFVGRDKVMDDVAQTLASGTHGVIGQSVAGLGGVGKTEVALHHAHAHRERYTGVWWVGADSPTNLTAGLAALAHRLAPATTVLPDEQAEAWATAWLCHHHGWLLILDNVEQPSDIEPLLGGVGGGRVLVTTRRDIEWASHGLTPIRLSTLTQAEAVQMLCERTRQHDQAAAAGVAGYLGCLPLALEQAAAYINHHHIPMAAYRDRLHDERAGSLLAGVAPGQDAQRAVTRVWAITLDALTTTNPTAVEILRVLAWLAPDDVPRDLITALTDGDQTAADVALGLLASYSMITLDMDTVSTHRLVQTVLRLTPPGSQATTDPSSQATQLLNTAIPANPDSDPAGWPRWRDLLPHVTALTDHPPRSTDTTLGRLLNQTALFEAGQGLYRQAELHRIRALAIAEATLGPDHPTVAIRLGNLASSYAALGRTGEAVPLELRALAIAEATLGPDHPDVAIRLGNLASSYAALGRTGEAVPLELRALAITTAAYGPDHPTIAISLGNLAFSYRDLGRTGEAVPLELRALAITTAAFGPDHPNVSTLLGNLANSYRDLGRPDEAVPLELRALAITTAAFGPDHPDLASCLGNLASSYYMLGRADEAVPLELRALAITTATFGPDHPTVATRLGNLASSYYMLGRADEALPLELRALAITTATYGPDHPTVATRLGNLASTYYTLGRPDEAMRLGHRAVQIADQTMPDDHPNAVALHGLLKRFRQEADEPNRSG